MNLVAAFLAPTRSPALTTALGAAVAVILTAAGSVLSPSAAASPGHVGAGWVYPIGAPSAPPEVARGFDPPVERWLAGHRGVDLRGAVGAVVRASGPGRISFAGTVAGRGVVVIDHGHLRTTYEPLEPLLTAGAEVTTGQPVGTLSAAGSHCAPTACLHWGARSDDRYSDPLALVRGNVVQLLQLGGRTITGDAPPPPRLTPPGPLIPLPPHLGPDHPPSPTRMLGWPLAGATITSPYGMRIHPVTGVYKLHDGTDFGAACGTPIRAAAAGRITDVGFRGAYGLRIAIEHAPAPTAALSTSYNHLSRALVTAGQEIGPGEILGNVGTTGSSTGCHLHFMVHVDGDPTDPLRWLM